MQHLLQKQEGKVMKVIPKALTALLCSSLLFTSAASHADEINRHNLKIAFVQAKNHPHGLGAVKFADLVKEKSDGGDGFRQRHVGRRHTSHLLASGWYR